MGVTSSLLNTEKTVDDPHSSEHLIALQQLQQQLDAARKQIQDKDQQLREKEKKVCGFK